MFEKTTEKTVVCSVISSNYFAQARVLQKSLKATNADLDFVLLVLDFEELDEKLSNPDFQIIGLGALGNAAPFRRMRLIYNVVEFATSVKPFLLNHLLSQGYEVAIYLDPDILVCGDFSPVVSKVAIDSILLTPHALTPYPRDGLSPSETDIMRAGVFNLGFIGVSQSAVPFLSWWGERLKTQCYVAPDDGLFTDQRWIDWVPSLFASGIEQDPGANVAYWNLHEREVRFTSPLSQGMKVEVGELAVELGKKVLINGRKLLFFHFSGYNPLDPGNISKHFYGNLRVSLEGDKNLSDIFDRYGAALLRSGYQEASSRQTKSEWMVDGVDYGPEVRAFLRKSWKPDSGEREGFPNPETEKASFISFFLYSNVQHAAKSEGVIESTAQKVLRSIKREGFQKTFLKIEHVVRKRWLKFFPKSQRHAKFPLASPLTLTASPQLTVATYAERDFSIGVVGERIESVLKNLGLRHQVLSYSMATHRWNDALEIEGSGSPLDIVLIVANADQTPFFAEAIAHGTGPRSKKIGYWFWELEHVPARTFAQAQEYVDEIWVSSNFIAQALRPVLEKKVLVVPLPLFDEERHGSSRFKPIESPRLNFTALAMGDFASVPERKNLSGAVAAFKKAFSEGEGSKLLLKVSNSRLSAQAVLAMAELQKLVAGRTDIEIIEGSLTQEEVDSLFLRSQVFVSLHRAEGLGLNIADAVCFGLPVISTAYGGCLDFLDPNTSFLVPFTRKLVGPGAQPYSPFAFWAEPDVDKAASYLREVRNDYTSALKKAREAKRRVIRDHRPESVYQTWLDSLSS